jgi:hypothetical protein
MISRTPQTKERMVRGIEDVLVFARPVTVCIVVHSVPPRYYTLFSACSMSPAISSGCSMPKETRIRFSFTPSLALLDGESFPVVEVMLSGVGPA